MRKKLTKGVSIFLACLLVFSMLPGQLVAAAAEAAYEVLLEPNNNVGEIVYGGIGDSVYNDVAIVYRSVYFLAQYTSSGIKQISEEYPGIPGMYGLSEPGYAIIRNSGLRGIISANGEVVFAPEYYYIGVITQDGYAVAETADNSYVLLDLNNRTSTSLSHINASSIYGYNNGRLLIYNGDNYQYVTLDGTPAFPGEYSDAYPFYNGYALVADTSGESWEGQVIDTSGKVILSDIDKEYSLAVYFSVSTEGLICVRDNNGKHGYIGLDGNYVIPPQYDDAYEFHNGFARVYNDKWKVGMIDTKGSMVIPYGQYENLSDASGTGLVWADSEGGISVLRVGSGSAGTPSESGEHIYDTPDPGEDTYLDAERLKSVTDPASAAEAVRDMTGGMTQAQKDSATGTDLATLYAETAVAKAASRPFTDSDILINAAAVADLETEAAQAVSAVDTALVNGGISTVRYLSNTVTFTTDSTSEISIRIDPDILTTGVDKIKVEGPSYTLTFTVSELKEDLTDILTFKAEPVNTADAALSSVNTTAPYADSLFIYGGPIDPKAVYLANNVAGAVKVTLPSGSTSNPVTISLPKDSSKDTTYQAVINSTGTATASKYNPATTNIDGKVNASGTYTVTAKEVNFTDITNKSAEMQKAIKYLASKGIISGTGGTNYSPDASISRAEIAALIVRALGKLNSSATNSFTDVKSSDWYYAAAGSSQKHGYISGFEDNTFKGTNPINKEQIVAVAARVLINDMKYKTPSNTGTYLSKYSDTVASWAQSQVALATKENLVVYRTDGTFSGAKNMTRGDAAIIIYRLFQKIW